MSNFQMGHCEDCLMYKCEVSSNLDVSSKGKKETEKLFELKEA